MTALAVHGGAESIVAHVEDFLVVAAHLDATADEIDALREDVARWRVMPGTGGLPVLDEVDIASALHAITGPTGVPAIAAQRLHDSAAGLRLAAERYQHGDSSVLDDIGHVLGATGRLFAAAADAAYTMATTRSAGAAAHHLLTGDPDVIDAGAGVLLFSGAEQLAGAHYPDGHAVVSPLGRDPTSAGTTGPRDLQDLIEQLAHRNDTVAGEISVSFVVGADGRRRAIVDIPGTKSYQPGRTADITSLSTNARAIVGAPTSYEHGVLETMERAGVLTSDQVMLVGHSEGGMVAVTAARDAVRSGRFAVTHVVTAGSPIGRTVADLPASVRVLALENRHDIVPSTDARANPARPNVTTVEFDADHDDIAGNHDLRASYAVGAAECDASDDPSVRAFLGSADGFLDSDAEETDVYLITRRY